MAEDWKKFDDDGYVILDKDFHTHTVYSHGKGTVRENVERAKALGLSEIAITDHGIYHVMVGVSRKNLRREKAEIESIRADFPDMKIHFGIESDLMGMSGRIDLTEEDMKMFDIILSGFHKPVIADKLSDYFKIFYNSYSHFIYKPTARQIANNTKMYINAIEKNPIDILTHPNYHLKLDMYEVAKACEEFGTVMELSSRHQDMTDADFEAVLKTNVMFALNSDAHKVDNIANVRLAKEQVKKFGIPPERIVNAVGTKYTFRSRRSK